MASLGELFIQLGVVGDTKELERLDKKLKEVAKKADDFVKTIKEEIEYNDKLEEVTQKVTRATQELAAAETEEAKAAAQGALTAAEAQKKRLEELKAAQEAAKAAHNDIEVNQNVIDGKKELGKNIAGVVKGIGVFVGALTGAAVVINKFTNSLVESNQAMLDLTRTTDIAQSTFQKWGGIGKMLGVENADQQLASLNQRLFDLMLTGEGARGFQLAGINPMGQDAEGVLEQLRARVSRMNDTTATYLLQQMGLDPKMLYLLRMSRSEFEALGQTIKKYQLSPEQTKQIQALNIQLQIAGIKLRYLKDRALLALMPYWVKFLQGITKVVDKFTSFVKWVKQGATWGAKLTKIVLGLAAGFAAWSATTVIVAKTIGFVTTAVKALQGVLLLLTAHPIIAGLTLLAGALYLIADDVVGYFQGKDSLIGTIINGLEDLDLKGFIDFPVPEWLEKLIKVIDFLNGSASERAAELLMDETVKKIDPDAVKVKNPDGSYGYAEIPPGYGVLTGGAAPLLGYTGELPNLDNMFVTPAMQRNLSYSTNNTSNTDNRQINQNISIQSSQPVFDIQNQLAFARNAITSGW